MTRRTPRLLACLLAPLFLACGGSVDMTADDEAALERNTPAQTDADVEGRLLGAVDSAKFQPTPSAPVQERVATAPEVVEAEPEPVVEAPELGADAGAPAAPEVVEAEPVVADAGAPLPEPVVAPAPIRNGEACVDDEACASTYCFPRNSNHVGVCELAPAASIAWHGCTWQTATAYYPAGCY